jgi:uncharacterized membrane protein HdeD (DUF308 family)
MLRASAFVSEKSRVRLAHEEKYYNVFAAVLLICGALLLFIPVLDRNGIFVLLAGWMFFFALALDLLRPLFYSRGVADVVMVILTSCFYALLGWAISGTNLNSIETYRIAISLALFLAGISRLLAFARMMVVTNLPLMPICGIIEMTAAVMIFMGWPDERTSMMYWVLGLTVILSGFECLSASSRLKNMY